MVIMSSVLLQGLSGGSESAKGPVLFIGPRGAEPEETRLTGGNPPTLGEATPRGSAPDHGARPQLGHDAPTPGADPWPAPGSYPLGLTLAGYSARRLPTTAKTLTCSAAGMGAKRAKSIR